MSDKASHFTGTRLFAQGLIRLTTEKSSRFHITGPLLGKFTGGYSLKGAVMWKAIPCHEHIIPCGQFQDPVLDHMYRSVTSFSGTLKVVVWCPMAPLASGVRARTCTISWVVVPSASTPLSLKSRWLRSVRTSWLQNLKAGFQDRFWPGARPTNDISIKFEIKPKFAVLWFQMRSTDHNEILHTSRQCNCRDECKISLWSVEHILI